MQPAQGGNSPFAGGIEGNVVLRQMQHFQLSQVLNAGRHLQQHIATQVQPAYAAKPLQEAGIDTDQAHVAQTQVRDMAEIDAFRQPRQGADAPAMNVQRIVTMSVMAQPLPGASNRAGHPAAAQGLNAAGGLPAPGGQGVFKLTRLLQELVIAVPRRHAKTARRGQNSSTWLSLYVGNNRLSAWRNASLLLSPRPLSG